MPKGESGSGDLPPDDQPSEPFDQVLNELQDQATMAFADPDQRTHIKEQLEEARTLSLDHRLFDGQLQPLIDRLIKVEFADSTKVPSAVYAAVQELDRLESQYIATPPQLETLPEHIKILTELVERKKKLVEELKDLFRANPELGNK